MKQEPVLALEGVDLDPDDAAVVGHADQEIPAVGVQKGGDGLEDGLGHGGILLALLQAPPQSGLEIQRLRPLLLEELLRLAVAAQVLVEEEVLQRLAEGAIVGDALVEIEVRIDDLLDHVLDLALEGQAHVLAGVRAGARVERPIRVELVHHLAEGDLVLGSQAEAEALVQLRDDAGERLRLFGAAPTLGSRAYRVEHPAPALELDLAGRRLLEAIRLHVDVLLHLARQLLGLAVDEPAQAPREDVQLLEVGVGEGQHLGEERVEANVVGELPTEVVLFVGGEAPEALDHRGQLGVQAVLGRLGVEVDACEGVDVAFGVCAEREQASVCFVEQVRVRAFGEQCRLVVRFEGLLDGLGLVGEIQNRCALLLGVGSVEPRQSLDGVDPAKLLVDVHGVEQGLVEAGLELVRDDQKAVVGLGEGLRGLVFGEAVHPRLGIRMAPVFDLA